MLNRATGQASARATDRLLTRKRSCSCDESLALQRKVFDAKSHIVAAIVRLAEVASSPTSSAGVAVAELRCAMSVLESEE